MKVTSIIRAGFFLKTTAALFIFGIAGCGKENHSKDGPTKFTGKIEYSDVEGGHYYIRDSNGNLLNPDNLEESYKINLLEITGAYEDSKNNVSFYSGKPVHIIKISIISGSSSG